MRIGEKEILVVGDRVLVKPDNAEERTKVGLVLPQSVVEKDPVQSGRIIITGPGTPMPSFTSDESEPWQESSDKHTRYIPVQAQAGDYALFLRKEAVEIRYRSETYLVVPQSAILLLIRGDDINKNAFEQ
ncbi:MAG: co-chaperone GroES family protein [Candidatus Sumerlaeota bacterium]|nr:co-chaperone GroES family protein [Candidatus Sumerlaeota bacterium]